MDTRCNMTTVCLSIKASQKEYKPVVCDLHFFLMHFDGQDVVVSRLPRGGLPIAVYDNVLILYNTGLRKFNSTAPNVLVAPLQGWRVRQAPETWEGQGCVQQSWERLSLTNQNRFADRGESH